MQVIASKLRYKLFGGLIPKGKLSLKILGYGLYVGGKWDQIGKLQFDFLVKEGLRPINDKILFKTIRRRRTFFLCDIFLGEFRALLQITDHGIR